MRFNIQARLVHPLEDLISGIPGSGTDLCVLPCENEQSDKSGVAEKEHDPM